MLWIVEVIFLIVIYLLFYIINFIYLFGICEKKRFFCLLYPNKKKQLMKSLLLATLESWLSVTSYVSLPILRWKFEPNLVILNDISLFYFTIDYSSLKTHIATKLSTPYLWHIYNFFKEDFGLSSWLYYMASLHNIWYTVNWYIIN